MKETRQIIIPAKTEIQVIGATCDMCRNRIKEGLYEVNEVTINHKKGQDYPEGGSGTEITIDMCGECFETKLIPWLAGQGIKPEIKEWSW